MSTSEFVRPEQPVEVWCNFDDVWSSGFVVERVDDDGIVVRRLSDGRVLPAVFGPADVRASEHLAEHHHTAFGSAWHRSSRR